MLTTVILITRPPHSFNDRNILYSNSYHFLSPIEIIPYIYPSFAIALSLLFKLITSSFTFFTPRIYAILLARITVKIRKFSSDTSSFQSCLKTPQPPPFITNRKYNMRTSSKFPQLCLLRPSHSCTYESSRLIFYLSTRQLINNLK